MLIVHTDDVLNGETRCVDGMLVSSAARTAFDVGRRLELVAGVQRVDAPMNAVDVKVSDIESVAAAHPGVRGLTPSQAKPVTPSWRGLREPAASSPTPGSPRP